MEAPKCSEMVVQSKASLGMVFAVTILILASAMFLVRGPYRAIHNSNDFKMIYLGSRAWITGHNAYQYRGVMGEPADLDMQSAVGQMSPPAISLYPPCTYAVIGPLGLLNWPTARAVWLAITMVLLAGWMAYLIRVTPLNCDWRLIVAFIAVTLVWSPLHTCLSLGQLSVSSAATAGVGLLMIERRRWWWIGGVLLGLGVALKPQVVVLLLLVPLVRRRYAGFWAAVATLTAVTLLSVVRLQLADPKWMADMLGNLNAFLHGESGDPTAANSSHFQLLNLHYPLHTFLDSRSVVNAIVWLLVAVQTIAIFYTAWRRRNQKIDQLLLIAALCAVMLTMTYHRTYDAVSLLFVVAWVMTAGRYGRALRIGCMICLATFLWPGAVVLAQMTVHHWISQAVADSAIWRMLVMPHQAWAAAFLAMMLTVAWVRGEKRDAPVAVEAVPAMG